MEEDVKEKLKRKPHGVRLLILLIMLVATVCAFVLHDYIFGDKSVFADDISRLGFVNLIWHALPKIIQSLQVVTVVLVIATVFMLILEKVMSKTQRGITVSRLINSFIKWIVAIVLIIVVLAIWGVNTTALITGAGVITLVVGLGMQSLIADVVAGLFIVFENEFNVGDIITVGGFRGQVVSIGIRTTKLEALGNLKIINNNEIKGVLNQSYKHSYAVTLVDIQYEADIPAVEKIIAANLSALEVERACSAVSYDGVEELGASGVSLRFSVECKEDDIFIVNRSLNKAVKNMFAENGIEIPFPQLVVHTADEGAKPAPAKAAPAKSAPARKTAAKTEKK